MDNSSKTIYFGFHTHLVLTRTGPHVSVLFVIIKYVLCQENEMSPGKGKLEGRWYLVPCTALGQDKASLNPPLDFCLTCS